jgi:hypothetical protein
MKSRRPDAVTKYLNLPEREEARAVADRRYQEVVDKGLKDPSGGTVTQAPAKLHWRHWVGATAEVKLAHSLGLEHRATIGRFHEKDVGNYQVRASSSRHSQDFRLILRPRDADADVFVCAYVYSVHSRFDTVDFIGWLRGREGKQPQYWTVPNDTAGRPPAYFIPPEDLHPMSTLPRL